MTPSSGSFPASVSSRTPETQAPSLLLIEDEEKTATIVAQGLRELGFHVEVATEGAAGLDAAMTGTHDVVVLDVGLPVLDGWEVLRRLRGSGVHVPVLFLTAHDGVSERVQGLDLGADDYLIKPFAFAELVARVRLLLRRNAARANVTLAVGDLLVDLIAQRAFRAGRRLDLTQTELSLLIVLMRHAPSTVSRRLLAEQVWDMRFDSNTNVVDVTVKRLRAKVDDPFPRPLIRTVRGVGYVCSAE